MVSREVFYCSGKYNVGEKSQQIYLKLRIIKFPLNFLPHLSPVPSASLFVCLPACVGFKKMTTACSFGAVVLVVSVEMVKSLPAVQTSAVSLAHLRREVDRKLWL